MVCKNKFFSKLLLAVIVSSSLTSFSAKALTQEQSQGIIWGVGSAVAAKLMTSGIVEMTLDRRTGNGSLPLAALMGLVTAGAVIVANPNRAKDIQFAAGLVSYALLLKAKLFNDRS